MADSKKAHFLKSPILKKFSRKFLRFVLGLVGLNDAKGIDVAQCIWPWGCPTKAQKQPKNAFSVLFGCFWAFVGQPHGHIRWATSMPFASFNPTNPRTNLRNFREKILRIGDFEKWAFFESAILNFFFASFPWKQAKVNWLARMGENFDDYTGFQPFFTLGKHFCPECVFFIYLVQFGMPLETSMQPWGNLCSG